MEFWTVHRDRERDCPRCRLDPDSGAWPPPDHTCRTAPATPAAAVAGRLHASAEVRRDRELRVRRERLADLDRWHG